MNPPSGAATSSPIDGELSGRGSGASPVSGFTSLASPSHGPSPGLLVKLQDDHPVNTMICMDFHGFGPIWDPGLG